eukprot:gene11112-13596_t
METRYSKSFFEDGFTVTIKMGNVEHKLSFSSSVTVDHVKLDIIKQSLPNKQPQDYFLAVNKIEILQIEFVRFIFAHEDIQKSLLTRKSVEVYLVPKSKEIIARQYKADKIKKQLGNYSARRLSRSGLKSISSPSSPKFKRNAIPNFKDSDQTSKSNTTTTTTATSSTTTSIAQNKFSPPAALTQNGTSTSPILPRKDTPSSTTTTTKTSIPADQNKIPTNRGQLVTSSDQDLDDEATDKIKLQLQQQLVLLEDEELKYQSNLLSSVEGSDYESSARDELSSNDANTDQSETEKESDNEKEMGFANVSFDDTSSASSSTSKRSLLSPLKLKDIKNIKSKEDQKPEVTTPTTQEDIELHWSEYLLMKPLKNHYQNFPVHITASKDLGIVMNCPKISTSSEYKQYIISTLENLISSIKVGTFATEVNNQKIALNSNSVIYNSMDSSIFNGNSTNSIPQLVVLKPGMQEFYKAQQNDVPNQAGNNNINNNMSNNNSNNNNNIVNQNRSNGIVGGGQLTKSNQSQLMISQNHHIQNNNNNNNNNNQNRRNDRITFALGEQRDVNAKAIQQRKKLTDIQIGSLLGKPLCWTNTENEIKYFRNLVETIFNFKQLDSRDRVKITLASVTTAPADPLLPSSFRIKFYLPPDNHSTTINVNAPDTVSEIIERIINKHNTSTKLISSDLSASDFVIRITGTSDHILEDCAVGNLTFVRNRLQRKKDIRFSIVPKSSIPDIYIDGYTQGLITLKDLSTSPSQNSIFNLSSSTAQLQPSPPTITGSFIQSPLSPRSNITTQQVQRSIFLYEINRPFEIRVICLEKISNQLLSEFIPDTQPQDIKLSLQVGLYHGEELLTELLETSSKPSSDPFWCERLRWNLLMCDIPRATKLSFTIYGQASEKVKAAIGWTDIQLIDYQNQLQTGVLSLILWPGDRTSIPNFNQASPSLVIEFSQFPFPVIFPRPEMMARTEIKDYVESTKEDTDRLEEIISKDPLYELSESDKKFLWTYRMHLQGYPHSLPKVLQSLRWNNPQEVKEAHRLLSIWSPLSPTEALELLDAKFADELVREYAVNCLRLLNDNELALYLLQLVQSLKHEPYHDSALCRFLIQRALNNRAIIGHPFFWHLEAEMHNPKISERYSLVLETYLKGCGDQRHEFVKQMEVVTKLSNLAKLIKESPASKRKALLQEELNKISLPNTFHLPISPSTESCGLIVSECRWLDSFTVPLYLVFQNVDPVGEPIAVIFKTGDDLRQDILTLQMISLMDNLWKQNGLDLHMSIYNVTAISEDTGFIEVVPDSDTTANIQKAAGGVTAAFSKTPLFNWLRERNTTEAEYEFCVQNFIHSLTGYCVATYILGISDRHNDNIMVSNSGHLFHIDFAHFLGNIMKFHGYKREKAPFVLTPEFVHVMGGEKSNSFKWFSDLCCLSYNIIRKHRNLFIILFMLMISTGIPELSTKEDIQYLREAFLMNLSDEEASKSFYRLIEKSLKTKTTQVMFAMHILAHPDKNNNNE